ncbi:sirohydrochlorin cobaltochelatase [Devosia enhydra]|uniref:Sirohydrochlorin cobaltochelatase n=1 Tax=Devosia enhydra TaxID=665118 RepID=A0A1K2HXE8_9HYPH|nr:sirohydrochlorin chelatase [Devosia enhydra]SFZ84284.1 sirohydrochlorin cobaltochelatase [Devosia enhydra]
MIDLPTLPPGTGVMLCGHGSRNTRAVGEFARLAEALRTRLPGVPVEYGYLEFADPVIRFGLDRLREQGVRHILAVPGMLFAAGHAKNDIPSVLNTYKAAHPGLALTYGRELGVDTRMLRAAGERIAEAMTGVPASARTETLLVVVGRGASDPDANANVAKVMRLLWEGMGFGWGETAYSGVTFPLVAPALEHAARLGYRRIVVFPYFLFTGVLVNRIYDAVDAAALAHPEIEFLKAPYLSDHPLVVDTFLDRIREMLVGENLMNCALCKYREQVLGFEAEQGLAQESHHHHVEGIGGGLEGCPCKGDCDSSCRDEAFCKAHGLPFTPLHSHGHDHGHHHGDGHHHHHGAPAHALLRPALPPLTSFAPPMAHHGHDHGHDDHHHHPYPHADHPLGPVTLPKVPGRLARKLRGEA